MRPDLENYKIHNEIHLNNGSVLYRATDISENSEVVLKAAESGEYSVKNVGKLIHERNLLQKLTPEFSARVLDWKDNTLILQSLPSGNLSSSEFSSGLTTDQKIQIAIRVCEALQEIHSLGVIHKRICPQNFFFEPEDFRVVLTEFRHATMHPIEYPNASEFWAEKQDLNYISPEQTGLVHTTLDYRSDLYQLGLTLFEWFTETKLFDSDDSWVLVHSHLFRTPPLLRLKNKDLPSGLVDILGKLLEKEPVDRYQNVGSVGLDLTALLEEGGDFQIEWKTDFRIQKKKVALFSPNASYGNQRQFEILRGTLTSSQAQQDVTEEKWNSRIVFLKGLAGSGKTSLALRMRKTILQKRGSFLHGSCSFLRRQEPYHGITSAFSGWRNQTVFENTESYSKSIEELGSQIRSNHAVLRDWIPYLDIPKDDGNLEELLPEESAWRYRRALQMYLEGMGKKGPVVLFVDDLQWADPDSLSFLKFVITEVKIPNLILFLAYEPSDDPLISAWISDIKSLEPSCLPISLEPLISEEALTTLTHNEEFSEDPVESRFRELDTETLRILQIASCIGLEFDLETLVFATNVSKREAVRSLELCMEAGLIHPVGEAYLFLRLSQDGEDFAVQYRFSHESFQLRAYSGIPKEEIKANHLRIGTKIWEECQRMEDPESRIQGKLFGILGHINKALELIQDEEEKQSVRNLNLLAGKKARDSGAYSSALLLLESASFLFPQEAWRVVPEEKLEWTLLESECLDCVGEHTKSIDLLENTIPRIPSKTDRLKLLRVLFRVYKKLGDEKMMMEIGNRALQISGVRIPLSRRGINLQIGYLNLKIQWLLRGKQKLFLEGVRSLKDGLLPELFGLFADWDSVLFRLSERKHVLLSLKLFAISLQKGKFAGSSIACSAYARVLISAQKDTDRGYKTGKRAMELSTEFPQRKSYQRWVSANFLLYIIHWKEPIKNRIALTQSLYLSAKQSGDFLTAGISVLVELQSRIFYGSTLDPLGSELSEKIQWICRNRVPEVSTEIENYLSFVKELTSRSVPGSEIGLQEEDISSDTTEKETNKTTVSLEKLFGLEKCYLLQEPASAWLLAMDTEKYADLFGASILEMEFYFYFLLSYCAFEIRYSHGKAYAKPESEKAFRNKGDVEAIKKNFLKLSESCPENFLPMALLVQAEWSRMEGQVEQSEEDYESCIEAAESAGQTRILAMAHECLFRLHLNLKKERVAKFYFAETIRIYNQWGAVAKCDQLVGTFPDYFSKTQVLFPDFNDLGNKSLSEKKNFPFQNRVDLKYLASITKEIFLQKEFIQVISKVLNILLEHGGATRAVYVLGADSDFRIVYDTNWRTEAKGGELGDDKSERASISQSIVSYVNRNLEYVSLNELSTKTEFQSDPYIRSLKPEAILSIPVIDGEILFGILYLENAVTPFPFTDEKIGFANFVASQVSTWIRQSENSNLTTENDPFEEKSNFGFESGSGI